MPSRSLQRLLGLTIQQSLDVMGIQNVPQGKPSFLEPDVDIGIRAAQLPCSGYHLLVSAYRL